MNTISVHLEQYHVSSNNMSVTVFHDQENKETFSSFERFNQYDRSKLCAVRYIQIEYNFLIKLPHANKTQNFKLEIKIGSAVPHILKWKEDDMLGFIDDTDFATAEIKINYVDFVVAQGLMNVVENWFNGLQRSDPTPTQRFIKKHKDKIATLVKNALIFSLSFLAFFLSYNLDDIIPNSTTPSTYFKAGILAIFTMWCITWFSSTIEQVVKKSFNEIYVISYIKLNRGDKIAIDELETNNKANFRKGLLSLSFAIVTGVCSSLIAWYITK